MPLMLHDVKNQIGHSGQGSGRTAGDRSSFAYEIDAWLGISAKLTADTSVGERLQKCPGFCTSVIGDVQRGGCPVQLQSLVPHRQ